MEYQPRLPTFVCPCGVDQELDAIDFDTDCRGRIWQSLCSCGRSWTVEVADDPDYPDIESVGIR